jgi:hypothetical protein
MKGATSMSEQTSENTEATTDGPREEYLLYVRVPDPEDQSPEATAEFLERIAELLTDDAAHIYVEPYVTYDDDKKTEGTHGRESGIKYRGEDHYGNSPDGTYKNTLKPMYFCHNKF